MLGQSVTFLCCKPSGGTESSCPVCLEEGLDVSAYMDEMAFMVSGSSVQVKLWKRRSKGQNTKNAFEALFPLALHLPACCLAGANPIDVPYRAFVGHNPGSKILFSVGSKGCGHADWRTHLSQHFERRQFLQTDMYTS